MAIRALLGSKQLVGIALLDGKSKLWPVKLFFLQVAACLPEHLLHVATKKNMGLLVMARFLVAPSALACGMSELKGNITYNILHPCASTRYFVYM